MNDKNPRGLTALVCTLALALGGVCLGGALLAQGGRLNPWLDLATHFALVWLTGALVATVIGVVLARGATGRALVIVGGLGVLASAALLAPELTRPIPPRVAADPARALRLIQFNAWDRNADPEAAANWIAAQAPNVVTVEEATPVLRDALVLRGFHYVRGMSGTAIFSRAIRRRPPFMVPPQDWVLLPAFARATFIVPGGDEPFSVVATHLNWPSMADHWPQREALARLLDRQPRDRLIIAGDFNLTSWSFSLLWLDRRFGLERRERAIASWPAQRSLGGWSVPLLAFLPIDHIYAGGAWRTVRVARGPRVGSDHYPLIVDLVFEP